MPRRVADKRMIYDTNDEWDENMDTDKINALPDDSIVEVRHQFNEKYSGTTVLGTAKDLKILINSTGNDWNSKPLQPSGHAISDGVQQERINTAV
jgi:hypothetical protein